jgi:transposase
VIAAARRSRCNWCKQADLDLRRRSDGPTSDERDELRRLRRENRILAEDARS